MPLALNLFKKTLKFPVLWISLIYLFWWMLIPTDASYRFGIGILIIYFIITVLETLSLLSINKILAIGLFIILLPFIWLSCVLAISPLGTASAMLTWLHSRLIYLPLIILFSSCKAYVLFQNSPSANKILHIFLFLVTFPVLAINIVYVVTYFPEVWDQKEFGNFKYYIVGAKDLDAHSYVSFYKCEKWSFRCNVLDSNYSGPDLDKIIIDKEKNEVSALRPAEFGLAFTDGDHPRVYEGYPVQLGNHVYQMAANARDFEKCATTPSCDSYTIKWLWCMKGLTKEA